MALSGGKVVAQVVILVLNYIFSKLVIFKKRKDGITMSFV